MRCVVAVKFESEIGNLSAIDRHTEFTALAFAQAVDNLLDIDIAIGRLSQSQQRTIDLRNTKRQRLERGDTRFDLMRIEQRISLIILNIEALDLQAIEQTEIDVIDTHLRTQLARGKACCSIDGPILHRPDIDQHRQRQRQNYRH